MNKLRGELQTSLLLARHTSWKVGGYAARGYRPADQEDLCVFLSQLPESEPLLWLGLGSNVLIPDHGFSGTVILTQGHLSHIEQLESNHIRVGAGVASPVLARFCAHHALSGLEFLVGIPGTLGGALAMNAGAHGREIWDFVTHVEVVNRQGQCIRRTKQEYTIGYRSVIRKEEEWFVAAELKLPQGNKQESLHRIREILAHRTLTQPNKPSAGSVFKNPENHYAGFLIEQAGLKGKQIGDAIISHKHANFIINQGNATSRDIQSLITLIQDTVFLKYGITLLTEVCILS
jgi:UDP-N-acetylmuramate dehydrogenase